MTAPRSCFLGLDVGTSATKAVAIDHAGRVIASASAPYECSAPHPGWSEQHPRDWWLAACTCIRQLLTSPALASCSISALGLSGQMHGSVLLDSAGHPLRPAILWNDQRTAPQCAAIEERFGGRRQLVQLVGNAALPGFTLPKLLWVQQHEPATWSAVRTVLLPKDFLAFMLTGRRATDAGDASGTLLLDVDARTWSSRALQTLSLDPALFPPVHESTATIGTVTDSASAATGLAVGTPVIIGSGDNMAGAVGAGVVEEGSVLTTLGTSGVVYVHARSPVRDLADPAHPGRLHTMCAAVRSAWCLTGCMLSAGGALRWARSVLAPDLSYESLTTLAATAPPGCEGLTFLPYLTGERCPHPNPAARAAFIGLTTRHTRAHLFRAVLEGITFGMAQILDLARAAGIAITSARATGGGNRSPFWRQLQADIYGVPLLSTNTDESGCALGAALLAAVGAGHWPTLPAACAAAVSLTGQSTPNPASTAAYARPRARFADLYRDLAHRFPDMT